MKKNAKSKRGDAERAAEHYCHEIMHCKRSVRAVRTQWQRQDMFSSDVIGKRADGSCVYIQVTAGQAQAVTARKRKLEKEIWNESDTVQLLQLVSTENPGKGARKLWFFRVYEYLFGELEGKRWAWLLHQEAIPVPKEWFKAYKKDDFK